MSKGEEVRGIGMDRSHRDRSAGFRARRSSSLIISSFICRNTILATLMRGIGFCWLVGCVQAYSLKRAPPRPAYHAQPWPRQRGQPLRPLLLSFSQGGVWMSSNAHSYPRGTMGSGSSVTGIDSARAGYHRTFEAAGTPDIDPLVRSQVREKLLNKRRERFSKEKGEAVLEELSASRVLPVRVLVDVDLRQTLRLTRREKKARLFIPLESTASLSLFLDQIYQSFPVEGMPHNIVVRVRRKEGSGAVGEEDGEHGPGRDHADTDALHVTLKSDEDLARALAEAQKEGMSLQVYIRTDKSAAAAMVPTYLRDMPDPRASPSMQMVSFYRFFAPPLESEEALDLLAKKLRAVWEPFGALGRVYVASEGINAQMAVPATVFPHFARACASLEELAGVYLNKDREVDMGQYAQEPAFDALHIRIREQVVADGGLSAEREFDWGDCGRGMHPEEWHEKVDDSNVLVLDCRNEFESEVGRFVTAEPLNTSFFRESWDVLKTRLADVPKDKPILTYCTGGIRCIKVGAYLKQELGFQNVARLEGGIVSYARHLRGTQGAGQDTRSESEATVDASMAGVIPSSKFKGINYVFDNRLGERITEDVLSRCDQCGAPSDNYVNCANPNCHVRFLQCESCGQSHHGCCSRGCIQARQEMELQSPKGGYPAPAKSVYPPCVEEAFPLLPLSEGRRESKKRVWLQPGPFQNARLNRGFDAAMDDFMAAETGTLAESDLLQRLTRETESVFPGGAHMLSAHSQGRLLAALTKSIGARTALEIGTFTGYATLCLAEGVSMARGRGLGSEAARDSGRAALPKVMTCEIDSRAAKIAQKYIDEAISSKAIPGLGVADVQIYQEPAIELLQRLAALPPGKERPQFDVIFVDGDKKRYQEYYDFILEHNLLAGGGIMIVDNVLWKGLVPELARRLGKEGEDAVLPVEEFEGLGFTKRQIQLAKVLHDFNMHVRADMRTEQAFLPVRDGLLTIRWKGFERTTFGEAELARSAQ